MYSRPPNIQDGEVESSSVISPVSLRSHRGSRPHSSSSREFRLVLDQMKNLRETVPRGPGFAWVEQLLQSITGSEYDTSIEIPTLLLLHLPPLHKPAFTPYTPAQRRLEPDKEVVLYPRVASIRRPSRRPRSSPRQAVGPSSRLYCCRETKTQLPPVVSKSRVSTRQSPPKYFLKKSSSDNSLELRFPRVYSFVRERRPSCSGVFSQNAADLNNFFPAQKSDSQLRDKYSSALTAPQLFPSKASTDNPFLRASSPPTLRPASSSVKSLCKRILSKHFPELRVNKK